MNLTVTELIGENNGNSNGITPEDIVNRIKQEYEEYKNVYAKESYFPTKIIVFPEEQNRTVEVNLEESLTTGECDLTDTNYEIIYDGEKISDTLIIPYQVELDGEMYRITEVNIMVEGGAVLPKVETIIYPNTVKRIFGIGDVGQDKINIILKNIILPNNLQEISNGALGGANVLEKIDIPESVKIIGDYAFAYCRELTDIKLPYSVKEIGYKAFFECESLTSITIPESVTSIGDLALFNYSSLTTVNYKGTEEQWNAITIGSSGNTYLTGVKINYNYTGE